MCDSLFLNDSAAHSVRGETIVGGYSCGPTVMGGGGRTISGNGSGLNSLDGIIPNRFLSLGSIQQARVTKQHRTQASFTRLLQNLLTKYSRSALSRRLWDHQ